MAVRKSATAPWALRIGTAAMALACACAAFTVLAQAPKAKSAPKTAPKTQAAPPAKTTPPSVNPDSVIATVGPLAIAREEFESRYDKQSEMFRIRSGSDLAADFVPI